jgi:hypothetical protein
MAEVLLFHAAQGQPRGFHAFLDHILARRERAAEALPDGLVYAGFSLGAGSADDAELLLYPGDQPYFSDSSLPS